ncbi:hypothetical protein RDABS01_013330 [Bienertia sinuspersici]
MKRENEDEYEAKLSTWKFGISGPVHLSYVDWRLPDHKRSGFASLVQGVYILERDRQKKRAGSKALAPPWWSFFHFQCIKVLVDPIDFSIFGAIFEYKPQTAYYHQGNPSRYIVVFRGTIIEPETRKRDVYLDMQLPLNGVTHDSRYQIAFQEIHDIVINIGPRNVSLVGHSLGASIALQAGKDLAKRGCHIESYLFNPPYTSPPIEKLNDHYLKGKVRVAKSFVTASLYHAIKGNKDNYMRQQHDDQFAWLCSWIPNLFVNPKDPVCCEYIGQFEHRERMKQLGLYKVDHIASKNSLMSVFGREGDPPHLIPSALLTKNMIFMEQSYKEAHSIEQWWQPHSYWHSKLYIYGE